MLGLPRDKRTFVVFRSRREGINNLFVLSFKWHPFLLSPERTLSRISIHHIFQCLDVCLKVFLQLLESLRLVDIKLFFGIAAEEGTGPGHIQET